MELNWRGVELTRSWIDLSWVDGVELTWYRTLVRYVIQQYRLGIPLCVVSIIYYYMPLLCLRYKYLKSLTYKRILYFLGRIIPDSLVSPFRVCGVFHKPINFHYYIFSVFPTFWKEKQLSTLLTTKFFFVIWNASKNTELYEYNIFRKQAS